MTVSVRPLLAGALILLTGLAAGAAPAAGGSGPPAAAPPAASAAPGGWVLPLPAPVTVVAGFRAPEHRYAPGHRGVDLAAAPGAEVLAPGTGTVSFTGQVAGRPVVTVDHGGGWRSSIEPVTSTLPVGTSVLAGTSLGAVGSGGHCDGRCIHWGVRIRRDYVDPMALVGGRVILKPLPGR